MRYEILLFFSLLSLAARHGKETKIFCKVIFFGEIDKNFFFQLALGGMVRALNSLFIKFHVLSDNDSEGGVEIYHFIHVVSYYLKSEI